MPLLQAAQTQAGQQTVLTRLIQGYCHPYRIRCTLLLQVAQRIRRYVELSGSLDVLLKQLARDHAELQADAQAAQACKELDTLLSLLQHCQASTVCLCDALTASVSLGAPASKADNLGI